ncbi:MAG: hypothetical protein DWQ48_07500 [Bacteroidetes bacterium]|nr:MAG: hypothetical protein DWQ48_07500 [Bacteroidota bacterium]
MGVSVLFLILIIILLIIILSSRMYKTGLANKRKMLRKKYQPLFMKLLFEDESLMLSDRLESEFSREDLRKPYHRKILMKEIIHLHENFTGEAAARLELLYVKLGFHQDSLRKASSKKWYIAAKGMRELALMNVKEHYPDLSHFLNSKNEVLRMEARIAMMKLSADNPLSFLSQITEPLTAWDQANIYSMLNKMHDSKVPDFSKWLNSPNKTVVLFCILMIGAYRQRDSVNILISHLDNPDPKIRLETVKALKELSAHEAEEKVISMYHNQPDEIKLEILRLLEAAGRENSVKLFIEILETPVEEFSLSIQAVRSLIACTSDAEKVLQSVLPGREQELLPIVLHAKNKNL